MSDILRELGEQLRSERRQRRFTQPDLAARIGRHTPRISELEQGLIQGRPGKDRLHLLAELCDALDLRIALIPNRTRVPAPTARAVAPASRFDDLFVDLSGDD